MRGIKCLGVYFDCSKVAFRETIQRLLVFQWGRRSRCYFKAFNEAHIIIFIYVLCLEGPLKWLKYFSHKCRRKAWKESLIHKVTNQLPNTLISNSTEAARTWDYMRLCSWRCCDLLHQKSFNWSACLHKVNWKPSRSVCFICGRRSELWPPFWWSEVSRWGLTLSGAHCKHTEDLNIFL